MDDDLGTGFPETCNPMRSAEHKLRPECSVSDKCQKPPALKSTTSLLVESSWFPRIDPAAQQQVMADITEWRVRSGSMLARYGENQSHWFGVVEGLLKWCVTSHDGRTTTLGGLSPGSWFGEGALLRGTPRKADIVALRDSRVVALPRETFLWLQATQGEFSRFLLHQINERMHWFLEDCTAHRLQDADQRVIRALVGLFHPVLCPHGQPYLRLAQEEIANLSGVSRQRCNAALGRLREMGAIDIAYGGVTVLDLEALKRRLID